MTADAAQPTLPVFLAWLEESRQRGQVHYDAKQQSWQVLGHPETVAVLSDPARFSSDLTGLVPAQDDLALFQKGNFVRTDPPRHRKLRGLVSQAFTPRMVAGLEPRIAEVTTELLDATGGGERLDLIESLAYPLPVIVIAELLGIPSIDRPTFRRWADTLFDQANIDPEDSLQKVGEEAVASVAPTIREMNTYLLDYIRSRRANPGQDLTSKLLQAEVDGERLDDQEIVGFVGLLLLAGHITTTATLGNTIVSFEENPDAATEIRADPSLLPAAIEEVLRYRTPFPRLARLATTNAQVGDWDTGPGAHPGLADGGEPRRTSVPRPEPLRHPPQAEPAPHLRAWDPLLPRCAAGPTGSQGRAEDHVGPLPRHHGGH
jgi:cytochrome P450